MFLQQQKQQMKLRKLRLQNRNFIKGGIRYILLSLFFPIYLLSDAHIFVFHRFGDDRHESTNTSLKELKREFDFLKTNGYKVIKLSTLINALKNHKKIDDKWVVLTIDDNFKSFYQNGFDLFKKYGYPFSLFVYVEATDKKYSDYTTWKELKEIAKFADVEYHSYSHPHMTYKCDDFLKADFKKGLKLFEKHMGYKPRYFAYPYGEFNDRVKKLSKEFGFEAILAQNIGAVSKDSDIYALNRNALTGKANLKRALRYKQLKLSWISPKNYPKNGILKHISAKLDTNKSINVGCYITKMGWRSVKTKNGKIDILLDKKLQKGRNRIVIGVKNKIYTKLLIKDKNECK